jgi:hypothetical protein
MTAEALAAAPKAENAERHERPTAARVAAFLGSLPGSAADLLVLTPLLLAPRGVGGYATLRCFALLALFALLDALAAWTLAAKGHEAAARQIAVALGSLAAAAALAGLLGRGLPVLALSFFALAAGGRLWAGRSILMTMVLAGAAAACRVDAGALMVGTSNSDGLLLAAAATAVFVTMAQARRAAAVAGAPGRATAPTRQVQARDLLLVLLLAGCVAANLAALGGSARLHALGAMPAFLPVPFLLLGLLGCVQLAWTRAPRAPRRLTLAEPVLAAATMGWAACALVGPLLAGS